MTSIDVVFGDCYLTDPSDPTVSIHASYPERGHQAQLEGEVRFYAGGRRRVITSARKSATYPVTLQLLSDAELAQLMEWSGRVLLLRDGGSRRIWGSFLSVDVESYYDPGGPENDVTVTLTEVDYDETAT